jgi:hypothetical protein
MSNEGARLHELHCDEDVWEYRGVSFLPQIYYYIPKWRALYEWINLLQALICSARKLVLTSHVYQITVYDMDLQMFYNSS